MAVAVVEMEVDEEMYPIETVTNFGMYQELKPPEKPEKNNEKKEDRGDYFQEEENKPYRNQIRRLGVKVYFSNAAKAEAVLALPEIHPNLQELVWENGTPYDTDESDISKIIVNENIAEHWKRITSFQDCNNYCLSSKILEHGGLCNLVDLRVMFVGKERSEFKCNSLIQQLSNAPKLKTLKLEHGAMSLSHLHQLHCNAQQLEVLWLQDMELAYVGVNEQRLSISPSNTLKELRISRCSKEYNENMLQHMKYPNLKTLQVYFLDQFDQRYGETQLVEFVSHCPYLETYDVNIQTITPAILGAIDASGAKLKKITITIWSEEDPLRQFKDVLKSNQKDFVHTMKINYSYVSHYDEIKMVIKPHNRYYQVTTDKETKCCKVLKIGDAYIDQP
ncbi:hypothetical protein BD408DRAFT_404637 [Parasitella parasitica]|nr:hypothetical protein BD408DRAFT_404637 [Parasitella parasitica]